AASTATATAMTVWRCRDARLGARARRSPLANVTPFGGSVWESNPSTVCLERSTGFEVREAHRVPRRFRRYNGGSPKRQEFTTDPISRSACYDGPEVNPLKGTRPPASPWKLG